MRDGSLPALADVLDHYTRGGIASDTRNPHITSFELGDRERADLLAFFDSLTDEAVLTDPRFEDPWRRIRSSYQLRVVFVVRPTQSRVELAVVLRVRCAQRHMLQLDILAALPAHRKGS